AVRLPLLLDLEQQAHKHGSLASVLGDEVPEPADLGLPDAVDTAEALLDAVRVPGKVVIDDQVGGLEIEALAGGVGSEEDPALGVLRELLSERATLGATNATVDREDRKST